MDEVVEPAIDLEILECFTEPAGSPRDLLPFLPGILAALAALTAVVLVAFAVHQFRSEAPVSGGAGPATSQSAGPMQSAETPTPAVAIPDDFPLAEGWPPLQEEGGDNEVIGPNGKLRLLAGDLLTRCGDKAEMPAYGDRLTARRIQPSDLQARELLVFASEEEANDWVESVAQTFQACGPVVSTDLPGTEEVTTVLRNNEPGLPSASISTTYEAMKGDVQVQAPHQQLIQLFVSGPAVLINLSSTEGDDIAALRRQSLREVTPVVDRLCAVFSTCP